jgi:hypothetical protein
MPERISETLGELLEFGPPVSTAIELGAALTCPGSPEILEF